MAVLNPWQRIDRVLAGLPFGDGRDAATTVSSNTTQSIASASCSGTSASTTLTLGAASTFANNDVVLIQQTRGTGVGQWEVNLISSGGGTTTLTLSKALQYTYTDSGASQAQICKVPMFTNFTLNGSTTFDPAAWAGDVGGILLVAARVSTTITGTVTASGNAGATGSSATGGAGRGFRGGNADDGNAAFGGEGTAAASAQSTSANGNGGGGGGSSDPGQGGGGGHANTGETGEGTGGGTAGSSDLTNMVFGGGGGGSYKVATNDVDSGGGGGGIVIIITKHLTVTGGISSNGGQGGGAASTAHGGGAGGAGGSILVACSTATLGSNLVTAIGGAGSTGDNFAADTAGSVGRIAVHHSGAVTGTTNPTFDDESDPTLVESSGFLAFM